MAITWVDIAIIIGVVLFASMLIVIITSVIIGKNRNWSGGKIFGLILIGMFFPPIWFIIILYLIFSKSNNNINNNKQI